MKSITNFISKKGVLLSLFFLLALTLFLNLYKSTEVPGCLNADEAAFGYNSYSILKTGHDEHGNFLPLRLRSFDDFKLPLYSYLSVPAIALFGMTDQSIRLLNIFVAIGLLFSSFILFKKIFDDDGYALLGGFFVTTSVWSLIVTRHAHEVALATLFIAISSIFTIQFSQKKAIKYLYLALLMVVLGAFTYHIGRIYLIFIVLCLLFISYKNGLRSAKNWSGALVSLVGLSLPTLFDMHYGVNRLSNLLFLNNSGFVARINEYISEHGVRAIHNKLVSFVINFVNNYISQLSPDFLVVSGDANTRFGFTEMGPMTPILYICAIVGIFHLFDKKNKYRYFVCGLLFLSPVGNALTWQADSLTRTFFLIVPVAGLASVGLFRLSRGIGDLVDSYFKSRSQKMVWVLIFMAHLFFLIFSLDVYFFHYFRRPVVQKSWQCGYKELSEYIDRNYDRFDRFYITKKNGQPYIFQLFYNQVDPNNFRKTAVRSGRDEYGFTQVEKFDKFVYHLPSDKNTPRTAYIGFPDEMGGETISDKIMNNGQEIFWVKENK